MICNPTDVKRLLTDHQLFSIILRSRWCRKIVNRYWRLIKQYVTITHKWSAILPNVTWPRESPVVRQSHCTRWHRTMTELWAIRYTQMICNLTWPKEIITDVVPQLGTCLSSGLSCLSQGPYKHLLLQLLYFIRLHCTYITQLSYC